MAEEIERIGSIGKILALLTFGVAVVAVAYTLKFFMGH